MRFAKPVVLSFSLLAFAAATAAQDRPATQPGAQPPQSQSAPAASSTSQSETSLKQLMDQKVKDSQGQDLGQIEDVVIDMQAGKVHAAVLEFGGFLGLGDKQYAFPMSELKSGEGKSLTVDVDKKKLENAEGFAKGQWPAMDSDYWGRVGGERQASAGSEASASAGSSAPSGSAGGASQGEKPNLVRASKIIDKDVQDNRGEKVGEVKDIVVGPDDGKLKHVVVNVRDAGQAMVQADAITVGTDDKLVLNMSAEELKGKAESKQQSQPSGGSK